MTPQKKLIELVNDLKEMEIYEPSDKECRMFLLMKLNRL